jgi:hypothetical protein
MIMESPAAVPKITPDIGYQKRCRRRQKVIQVPESGQQPINQQIHKDIGSADDAEFDYLL